MALEEYSGKKIDSGCARTNFRSKDGTASVRGTIFGRKWFLNNLCIETATSANILLYAKAKVLCMFDNREDIVKCIKDYRVTNLENILNDE